MKIDFEQLIDDASKKFDEVVKKEEKILNNVTGFSQEDIRNKRLSKRSKKFTDIIIIILACVSLLCMILLLDIDSSKDNNTLVNESLTENNYDSETIVDEAVSTDIVLPYSSDEICKMDLETVKNELKTLGFNRIELIEVKDLENEDEIGKIGNVEINGISEFGESASFPIDSKVKLIYHSILEERLVINVDNYNEATYKEVLKALELTKFNNVTTEKVEDTKKDNIVDGQVESITVNGDAYNSEQTYPINSKVVIKYSNIKHKVTFNFKCYSNIFFNKYDIAVFLDSKELGTIGHGEEQSFSVDLEKGNYTLILKEIDGDGASNEKYITIKRDGKFRYELQCKDDTIDITSYEGLNIPFTNKELNDAKVSDVKAKFKSAGYKNITIKPLKDLKESNIENRDIVSKISIDEDEEFDKNNTFYSDSKVVIWYHSAKEIEPAVRSSDLDNLNYEQVEEKFKKSGFTNVTSNIYEGKYGSSARNNYIHKITANGKKFYVGDEYPFDAEINIEYYSIEYKKYTVSQMIKDLENNAYNANEKYKDQYVEITGTVDLIDASGKYIKLRPSDNKYAIQGVECDLTSQDQKEKLSSLSTGKVVTIRGKITVVGEFLAYALDIHEIIN